MARAALLLALVSLLFAGCAARQPAPVTDRTPSQARVVAPPATVVQPAPRASGASADTYTVKHGDTLYSIARDKGLDFRELSAWNNLDNASSIREGQQLRLTPPPNTLSTSPLRMPGDTVESRPLDARTAAPRPVTPPSAATRPAPGAADRLKTGPKAVRVPYSEQAWAQMSKPEVAPEQKAETTPEIKPDTKPDSKPQAPSEPVRATGDGTWIWPASGKVITTYNGTTSKGIDIAGKMGQPVTATASGRVIYSGIGPRGLGNFIVIQHSNDYISIYGNNKTLLVKEKQSVTKGQKIAEMGDSDSDQVKLHFEIRRFSKPVDPLTLLPDRG
jgi:lipoprotein NlpD